MLKPGTNRLISEASLFTDPVNRFEDSRRDEAESTAMPLYKEFVSQSKSTIQSFF